MSDIVDRLRRAGLAETHCAPGGGCADLLADASDEIKRLRSEVAELRQVVAMAKLPTEPTPANRAFPNPFKVII